MRAVVAVLLLVACSALAVERYDGYKVYRVVPRNVGQLHVLQRFEVTHGIDFWSKGHAVERASDVMVAPQLQHLFEAFLRMHGIKYSVMIPNVQSTVDAERALQMMAPKVSKGRITFTQYHTYTEIVDYMQQLAADFPSVADVETIGKTAEGRDLYVLKVSSGTAPNAPAIVVDCGIHAREWIAPAMCVYIMQELVEDLNNRAMIENVDWYIVPVLNPDGYSFSHSNSRFWRKTRTPHATSTCIGVDANRNWDFHWMETGASSNPCDETFAGPQPASTSEVQALAGFAQTISNKQLYLTFHSYGQYLLYPWGWTSAYPENRDDLHALAVRVNDAIRSVEGTTYEIGSSTNVLYAAAGGSDDWMMGVAGIPLSYTIELPGGGTLGFDLPASRIDAVVKETWEGVRVYWGHIEDNFTRK